MDRESQRDSRFIKASCALACLVLLGCSLLVANNGPFTANWPWILLSVIVVVPKTFSVSTGMAIDGSLYLLLGWLVASPNEEPLISLCALLVVVYRFVWGDRSSQLGVDALMFATCSLCLLAFRQSEIGRLSEFSTFAIVTVYALSHAVLSELWLFYRKTDFSSLGPVLSPVRTSRLVLGCFAFMVAILYPEKTLAICVLAVILVVYLDQLRRVGFGSVLDESRSVRSTQALVRAHRQKASVEKRLADTDQKRRLLEGLAEQLAGEPKPEEIYQALAKTLPSITPFDNLVFFRWRPDVGSFVPVRYFRSDSNAQVASPIESEKPLSVKMALDNLDINIESRKSPNHLGDMMEVAVPLAAEDIMYVGRQTRKEFEAKDIENLNWVAQKAGLALRLARNVMARSTSLKKKDEANYQLQTQVALLSTLQLGFAKIGSTIETARLTEIIRDFLFEMFGHDEGLILFDDRPTMWSVAGNAVQFSPLAVRSLQQRSPERPLLIQDLSAEGSEPVHAGAYSLIYAPLFTQGIQSGCLVLTSRQAFQFTPEHRELLSTIASQCGLALTNASNYEQVVRGREALEKSQAQLIQASKMSAVGQLAAGLAHEMNTPLGVVSVSLESLERKLKDSPPKVLDKLVFAQVAVEKIRVLVKQLLHHSRQSNREREFKEIAVSLLIRETLSLVENSLQVNGIEVATRLEEGLAVMGRFDELQQVLTNLLLNAADATVRSEKISPIMVLCTRIPRAALIEVRDQGVGISESDIGRVFEPFFTTKEVGEGTGLGLSVSYQIVEAHNGKLEVKSGIGLGTSFFLTLPLKGASLDEKL